MLLRVRESRSFWGSWFSFLLMANYEVDSVCPPSGNRVRRRRELVKVRLTSWNIGSLTEKSIELVKILHKRRIV